MGTLSERGAMVVAVVESRASALLGVGVVAGTVAGEHV